MKNLMFYGVSSLRGGVETFVFNLIEQLDKNEFRLFLFVNSENYADKEWLDAQKIEIIVGPNRRQNPLGYKKEIKKILLKYKIDIVWSNLTSLSDITLLEAAKEIGINQRIAYSHQSENMGNKLTGMLHNFNKRFKIKEVATDYWACSNLARDYFYNNVVSSNDCQVFVNAVNPEVYKFNSIVRDKKRNELKASGRFVIGTVGRLTTEKNQKFLIELVENLKKDIPNIICFIIGSGLKKEELNDLIEAKKLEDDIKLLGQREDVAELLNAFDIFVLPSLFEGLPFVLVESQMNGLDTLVSTNVSRESAFTEKIKFLNLDIEKWSNEILQIYNHFKRSAIDPVEVNNSPFNLVNNIKDFESRLR